MAAGFQFSDQTQQAVQGQKARSTGGTITFNKGLSSAAITTTAAALAAGAFFFWLVKRKGKG